MFKVNKIFVQLHFLSLYRNDFVSKRPVVSWCCGNDVIQKIEKTLNNTPHTNTKANHFLSHNRIPCQEFDFPRSGQIPSTNFAFSRILHYISVNSWVPGKRSLATKLCPSQVSFESYRSNIVCLLLFLFVFVKTCTAPRKPLMLHNHQSVFWEDSQGIVVLGGGGNCFSFGTHLNEFPVLIDLPLP